MSLMNSGFDRHLSPVHAIPFLLIRKKRKTVSIHISDDAAVVVYAPYRVSLSRIRDFVDQKEDWIRIHRKQTEDMILLPFLDIASRKTHSRNIRRKAEAFLRDYDGPKPNRIFIRYSRSRWGSCSSLGNISLNGYLDLLPDDLFFYVLCHELTHLRHMDHSPEFWSSLARMTREDPRTFKKALGRYRIPSEKGSASDLHLARHR